MLVSLPDIWSQGQIRIEAELLSVEWYGIFDDQCCFDHFRPDPAWDITLTPRFYQNGAWNTLTTFTWCDRLINQQPYGSPYGDENNTFSHVWPIYPPPFADYNTIVNYREFQTNLDVTGSGFDLCNNSLDLRYWTTFYESDAAESCDETGGDYVASDSGFRYHLSTRAPTPGVWHTVRQQSGRGTYGYYYTIRYRYTFDAIKETIRYTNTANGTQPTFCEGDTYRIAVDYEDSQYNGGIFEWQSSNTGSAPWTPEPETTNYLDRQVTLPLRHYRVRMKPNSGCIYDNQDWISTATIPAPTILTPPPDVSNINVTLLPTCGTDADMSIRFDGISNYDPNTQIRLTLVDAGDNVVANAGADGNNPLYAGGSHLFSGLNTGTYSLKVTTVIQEAGLSQMTIGNCTVVKSLGSLAHLPDPVLVANNITQPTCPGGQGSFSFSVTNGNGPFNYTLLDSSESSFFEFL